MIDALRSMPALVVVAILLSPSLRAQVRHPSAVADAISAHAGAFEGWPPFLRLQGVPKALKEEWEQNLIAAETAEMSENEHVLGAILREILAQAEAFEACDWNSRAVTKSCYRAWLRYHLGADLSPDAVYRWAVYGRGKYGDNALALQRRSVPSLGEMWSGAFTTELQSDVQRTDARLRAWSRAYFPFEPSHTEVSVSMDMGGSVASYTGADRAGVPRIRIDTAAARTLQHGDLQRVIAHEVWPGHHLMVTVTPDLLHEVLRGYDATAYREGWATYAEILATEEEGLDDGAATLHLANLALLAQVDVGLHDRNWGVNSAVDTLRLRGSYSMGDARRAVQGILARPGRQGSYFIGYLAFEYIRSVREGLEGEAFDLARFHADVLRHGPMPLNALRAFLGDRLLPADPTVGTGGRQ